MTRLDLEAELLDERRKIVDAIRKLLDAGARPSVVRILTHDLSALELDGTSLLHKLRMLTASGVTVTLIFGARFDTMRTNQREHLKELVEANVNVFHNKRMHAKLILIETAEGGQAVLGSANLTPTAMTENHEIAIRSFRMGSNTYDALSS